MRLPYWLHRESYFMRHGCGISCVRNDREARALYEFCKEQISTTSDERKKLNRKRFQVYKDTMTMYEHSYINGEDMTQPKFMALTKRNGHNYTFIGLANHNAEWYWN